MMAGGALATWFAGSEVGGEANEEQLAVVRAARCRGDMTRWTCEHGGCGWVATNMTPMLLGYRPDREVADELARHELGHRLTDWLAGS